VTAGIEPVLKAFAGPVVHTGPTGTAHTMKRIHSFRSMGYAALSSEAPALGAEAVLSAQTFDSVIRGGRMDCGFYQTLFEDVHECDPDAHKFTLSKDLSQLVREEQTCIDVQPICRNIGLLLVDLG
jgi:3-hydroxyisobutyrate dehydrogenase-like beta-hydroxyacid dehydrogenase